MKKKFISVLACILMLTGCSSSTELLLPYQGDTTTGISISSVTKQDTDSGVSLFAKDLCVYSVNAKDKTDSVMTAESSMLVNATDKKVLFANNIYDRVYPASVTKIVTTMLALKYGNLNDNVTVSYDASHITEPGATKCGLNEGDQVALGDLLYGFLLCSGNDAGIAIAEHISGDVDSFAKLMNEETKKLGCVGSNFVNPHGLHDDNHYTTTYDMYLILNELLTNDAYKDEFIKIIHSSTITMNYKDANGNAVSKTYDNTNRYLLGTQKMPENVTVIGGKTGTTSMAGACLVLYSQGSDGKDYMSFVFHADSSDSLYTQMSHLLDMVPASETKDGQNSQETSLDDSTNDNSVDNQSQGDNTDDNSVDNQSQDNNTNDNSVDNQSQDDNTNDNQSSNDNVNNTSGNNQTTAVTDDSN